MKPKPITRPLHLSIRFHSDTADAIERCRREYSKRDDRAYSFSEVLHFLVDLQLHALGKYPNKPTLRGRGSRQASTQQLIQSLIRENAALRQALNAKPNPTQITATSKPTTSKRA